MGNYLSRDEILSAGFRTQDVEAFGGTVCVREMPADLVDKLMKAGLVKSVTNEAGVTVPELDMSKVDFIEVAARTLIDPATGEPLFSKADLEAVGGLGFSSIKAVATAAMNMIGGGEDTAGPNG